MQKLQLYIDSTPLATTRSYVRVDLFKDETVSLTQTIQNVKDISKIFTEFSKTFSLPASSVNNKIFIHYYNSDIVGGFDARNKVASIIELNTLPFKEGFIKLTGVELKNNVPHTYKVTFYGNTINLVDVLGDDQLSRLDQLGTYDTTYQYSTVKSGLTSTLGVSTNLCVPLITHTDRLTFNSVTESSGNVDWVNSSSVNGVDYKQLKFALRLQAIIDAIETSERYQNEDGTQKITFSNDFFNDAANTKFHNLWMWLHRKKGNVEPTVQLTLNFIAVTPYSFTSGFGSYTNNSFGVITLMPLGQIDADGGTLQWIQTELELTPTDASVEYSIRVLQNSEIYEERLNVQGTQTFFTTSGDRLSPGSYSVQIASIDPIAFASTNIEWNLSGAVIGGAGGGGGGFTDVYSNTNVVDSSSIIDFTIIEQIPEMTVMNFLTSIFKMFNLTAFVNNSGVIVVRTLDSYYSTGSTNPIVIDQYLDVTKSTVDVALPFKEIVFGYKGLGTFLAKQYNQVNNSGWGSLKHTLENETFDAPNNTYKVEVPFEHVMYERLIDSGITSSITQTSIQYGFFVNENQESYYGLPLIFYAIRQLNGNDIAIKNNGVNQQINDYIIPSNSLEIGTIVRTNINFNSEINEFDGIAYTGTLFQNQYLSYINDIFNSRKRLTKVTAMLPLKIFYDLELNDTIQIRQENYRINSITTNLMTGKSQLELLNIVSLFYATIEDVSFQGSRGILYYRSSIGQVSNLAVGDVMNTNKALSTFPATGTYTQQGVNNDIKTYCNAGENMVMVIGARGIITSIGCFAP